MAHLIDKTALVAEIERLKADAFQKRSQCKRNGLEKIMHQIGVYNKILSFLDTLEVTEVDLCKEEERIWKDFNLGECHLSKNDLEKISKHFFELGIAVSNKAQKGENNG